MASTAAKRSNISYEDARARILAAARPLPPEMVSLEDALGRALRETIIAPHDLPPFDNSAMDGFAVRSADLAGASAADPVGLKVIGTIAAGQVALSPVRAGEAYQIMTGAMIPEGADAVVPFEEAERRDSGGAQWRETWISKPVSAGTHVRIAGDDITKGAVALEEGRELSPYDIALLASLGIARVPVGPGPRVAVLSTGDELLDVGEPLQPGRIRDSNLLMMKLLLAQAGCRVVRAARLADRPEVVALAIEDSLNKADVVITLGGVSMGDFDPVADFVAHTPWIELWRVSMRPGQPQAFGERGGKLFFALPGNPASVACTFEALVRPALRKHQGFNAWDRPKIIVRAAQDVPSKLGRTDFVRVTLEYRDREWWAKPAGMQLSGHVSPQSRANALLVLRPEIQSFNKGTTAEALVLVPPTDSAPGSEAA